MGSKAFRPRPDGFMGAFEASDQEKLGHISIAEFGPDSQKQNLEENACWDFNLP